MKHLGEVSTVLQANELYVNLKKCSYMIVSLIFLGFVVSSQRIYVHKENKSNMGLACIQKYHRGEEFSWFSYFLHISFEILVAW